MRICATSGINFQRRLKPKEEAEYCDVLKQATKAGKKVLIVPASSLPNKTGVGNLGTDESQKFFDFAKKYWGINEIQILPSGQYHRHNTHYPIYSGTSMDLGNHVINLEHYTSEQIISQKPNIVDFRNVIEYDSEHEKIVKKLYQNGKFKPEFEKFKSENAQRLEAKALYRALREINGTYDYKGWNEIDKNLFELDVAEREKRIGEIKKLQNETMDFYYYKQFLAEDSLKKAKESLNKKGLKLSGDMLCGFSYDEVWANPKAFHKDASIGWGLPALNFDTPEGEKLLREKVRFYAERFDGLRVDAAWTYADQPLITNGSVRRKYYTDKVLNIIDDEVKKVKGAGFDPKSITYEFATSADNFNLYDGSGVKPYVAERVKIYTSDYLSESWGSCKNFLERGWKPDSFIIGASNHDSPRIEVRDEQAKALSKILKIPYEKLSSRKEFIKAKLAEPMGAENNMIYFTDALNLERQSGGLDILTKIPDNYQEHYFRSLENGEGFNPMDALEKIYRAEGLDKKDPKLFRKIVKYRKILERKEKQSSPVLKWVLGVACCGMIVYGVLRYWRKEDMLPLWTESESSPN